MVSDALGSDSLEGTKENLNREKLLIFPVIEKKEHVLRLRKCDIEMISSSGSMEKRRTKNYKEKQAEGSSWSVQTVESFSEGKQV